ncbi:MAG: hypothetical protein H0U60_08375 [Blastocatellia bacterium]|nr:hypothetical protein [Blastocatellia bacterium]
MQQQQDVLARLYFLVDKLADHVAILEGMNERLDLWERRSERMERLLVDLGQAFDHHANVSKTERTLLLQQTIGVGSVQGDANTATVGNESEVGQIAAGNAIRQREGANKE